MREITKLKAGIFVPAFSSRENHAAAPIGPAHDKIGLQDRRHAKGGRGMERISRWFSGRVVRILLVIGAGLAGEPVAICPGFVPANVDDGS